MFENVKRAMDNLDRAESLLIPRQAKKHIIEEVLKLKKLPHTLAQLQKAPFSSSGSETEDSVEPSADETKYPATQVK